MAHKLSNRVNRLSESATIAMAQKSRELKAKGLDIISLSLGEPDFHTPDFIKEAAHQAIDDNFSTYTPVPGYQDLREAAIKKFKRDNGLEYSSSQILFSTGAKQCINNAIMCLSDKGDEVVIPAPFWVTYEEIVKMANATPVIIETEIASDFKVTPQQLRDHLSENTKVLLFSSPCNPTGSVYSKEELTAIAEVLKDYPDVIVVADEIYEHINFIGVHHSMANIEGMFDRTVTVNGVSKAFAMTGWRVGFMAGPQWIIDACNKMQGQVTSATCSIAQRAAKAALEADPVVIQHMTETFLRRRDMVLKELSKIEFFKLNEPEGAFYIFPDVSACFEMKYEGEKIENADNLCLLLLEKAQVALVTGGAFGAPNCIRFSYAAADDILIEACNRLIGFFSKLEA